MVVYILLLRSEITSGMRAKLRTVQQGKIEIMRRNLSYYCLRSRYIYNGVILHAHPVRG